MSIVQHNGLRYFQFDSLNTKHAIFTRHGGISPEPWNSLNVGGTVGDDLERVRRKRDLSFEALGCAPDTMFDVWQVHSADVVCVRAPRLPSEAYRQADIILTDRPEVTLFMRFADCVIDGDRERSPGARPPSLARGLGDRYGSLPGLSVERPAPRRTRAPPRRRSPNRSTSSSNTCGRPARTRSLPAVAT